MALAALNLKKCEVIKTAGDTNNLCVKTTLNEIDNDITQFLRMNIQRVASFDSVRFQWKAIEDSDMVWHADHSRIVMTKLLYEKRMRRQQSFGFYPLYVYSLRKYFSHKGGVITFGDDLKGFYSN